MELDSIENEFLSATHIAKSNQSSWLKLYFWLILKTGRIQILARPQSILMLLMVFLCPLRQMLEQYLKLHNHRVFPNSSQVTNIQCYIVRATVSLNTQCNATHNWIIIPENNYITFKLICTVHLLNHNLCFTNNCTLRWAILTATFLLWRLQQVRRAPKIFYCMELTLTLYIIHVEFWKSCCKIHVINISVMWHSLQLHLYAYKHTYYDKFLIEEV